MINIIKKRAVALSSPRTTFLPVNPQMEGLGGSLESLFLPPLSPMMTFFSPFIGIPPQETVTLLEFLCLQPRYPIQVSRRLPSWFPN